MSTGTTRGQRTSFAALLRTHRVAAGLTQEALAERAALSARGLKYLEQGARVPHPETVRLLADALALSAQDRAQFQEAARRLGTARATVHLSGGSRTEFVGRAPELDLLERHLAGAGPPVLLLAGEPGIGKSCLLDKAAQRAQATGWSVLAGGCQRRGGQVPYAPLLEAVEAALQDRTPAQLRDALDGCAWLVLLLPELADGPIEALPTWNVAPEHERRLMFKAVARLLANVSGPAGTLLLLDDLQWAGADALDLLTMLVRAADAPIRVVGAYRDTEVAVSDPLATALADLAQRGLACRYVLPPLAPEEAKRLADLLLADVAGDRTALAAGVLMRAGGNPLFVVSCAQALQQRATATDEHAIPWDVAQGIRLRVEALPSAAREMLGVAALIGRTVPPALLTRVTGQQESAVCDALDAAHRARLVIEVEAGYQFAHDLIREVVEDGVGRGRRMALHRRIAACLEREEAGATIEPPLAVLAYHYERSGEQDKAADYLERAGDSARAHGALAAAEDAFRKAVQCLDGLGRALDAARVREKVGRILVNATRFSGALAVLEQAAEALRIAGDLDGLGRVLARIGYVRYMRETVAEGAERLEPLLALFEARGPSVGLAGVQSGLANLLFQRGQLREALAASARAAEIARLVGEDGLLAQALTVGGSALMLMGRDEEALPLLREVGGLAEAAGDLELLCQALLDFAWIDEERGEFAAGRAHAARALALAERLAFPAQLVDATLRLGALAFNSGDWSQARASFERVKGLAEEAPFYDAMLPLDRGRLAMAEGAWEEAAGYLEECSAFARRTGSRLQDRVAASLLAERDLLEGRPEEAIARLLSQRDREGIEERIVTTHILPVLAWAYLEFGDMGQAERTIAEALRRARASGYRLALVGTLRVRALVALRQGDRAAAEHALEEGLALARPIPNPYGEGRLLHVYGLLHMRMGERERARELLEAALAIFQRLGARKDRERVEERLVSLG
jgi:tetratricopeptide (TPR) repeat protein/transcriptional regulator with XRE-family HTH domain